MSIAELLTDPYVVTFLIVGKDGRCFIWKSGWQPIEIKVGVGEGRETMSEQMADKLKRCATCGRIFDEYDLIKVVSDEYELHYVCAFYHLDTLTAKEPQTKAESEEGNTTEEEQLRTAKNKK